MSRPKLVVVAVVGAAVAAVALLWLGRDRPADVTTSARPVAESEGAEPVGMAPAQADAVAAPAADSDARAKLQSRLDAIAQAYNDGNVKAIEAVLWPNHAVVRPNGEHHDRNGLLQTWETEWTRLHNRELKMAVLTLESRGEVINATWSVDLTADVYDEENQAHRYELHGVQQASYRSTDGQEMLEGPITYAVSDQTMDGEDWISSQ